MTWLFLALAGVLLIAGAIATPCAAHTQTGGTCTRAQWGPFMRCWQHGGEVRWTDFLILGLWAIAGVVGWFAWVQHGGVPLLVQDAKSGIEHLVRALTDSMSR